jgi:hypothetical protein
VQPEEGKKPGKRNRDSAVQDGIQQERKNKKEKMIQSLQKPSGNDMSDSSASLKKSVPDVALCSLDSIAIITKLMATVKEYGWHVN